MRQLSKRKTMIAVFGALVALSAISAPTLLAAGQGTVIHAGNLVLHADASMSPKALPKNEMVPISLRASGSVETADGTHIPPATTLDLQVDRNLRVDSAGLPSCTAGKITATDPAHAMKACGEALVGRGFVTAEVEFPESAPFKTRGPLLVFNGPSSAAGPAYPEMFFYTYVSVPAPTAIIVPAKLSKDSGRYGFTIATTIPRVAGGSGSLTGFELTVNRKWTYKGRQHSYLNAECPDGHLFNQVEATFGDGTELTGTLVNGCQSKR